MPALNTQGLVSGFQQGFGMARQYALDAENQRRYETEQQARQQASAIEQQRYQDQQARLNNQDTRAAEEAKAAADYRANMLASSERAAIAQEERARAVSAKDARDALIPEGQAYLFNFPRNGKVNPELEAKLKESGLSRFLPSSYIDPENYRTLMNLERMGTEIVKSGDIERVNNPEFLDAMNVVFKDEINRGAGQVDQKTGKKIVGKKLAGFSDMGDGRFTTAVTLQFEDGTLSEPRPITMFRSSDENDPVSADDPEALINMVFGRAEVARQLQGARDTISSAYNEMSGKNDASGRGSKPASVQTIEYLTGTLNIPEDQAVDLVFNAKKNPQAAAIDLTKVILDQANENNEDMTFDQAYQKALQTLNIQADPKQNTQSSNGQAISRPIIDGPDGPMILSEDGTGWEPYNG